MNILDKFLTDHMTPERRDMFLSTNELLIKLGHVDHELNIDNLVAQYGNIETLSILMLIEDELIKACHSLLLSYFIVCRTETTLPPYLRVLEFLDYIENTIDSETVIYYYNDELSPQEQFMSWVEVFREDLVVEIGSLVLDVTPTLIENILQTHELKVDVHPIEFDEKFHHKLKYLKALKEVSNYELLGVKLIKSQTISQLHDVSTLVSRFSKLIYTSDSEASDETAYHILSLCLLSDNEVQSLKADILQMINDLYDDVKKTNLLISQTDAILSPTGELCKIMNTI